VEKRGDAVTAAEKGLVNFTIDTRASLFTVQAFASGIVAVVAHSPKFAMREVLGEIRLDPRTLENSSVRITVRLASLEITDEVTSTERREIERVMFDEVLEKSVYPNAEFHSTKVSGAETGPNMYRINLRGDITLHGITRGLALDSQVVAGEDTLRAQGSFSLSQADFNLKIASVAGGTLKLKDELKFGFFVVARRKQ
jgi:polyisoprenoid-binding protein YceI